MSRGYVSAQDVARLAGVSRSAVSRCFTDGASIAPETRDRVMHAAATLGYQVNDLARGLINRSSRLVGLVVTDPTGFRAHLLFALTRLLIERGSVPVVINTGTSAGEQDAARRILIGHRAEASIVLSGTPPSDFIDLARQNGQPVVLIGRGETGLDAVQVENAGPARHLARMFHAAGHRRLGLVSPAAATPMIARRARAFADEAVALGCELTLFETEGSVYHSGFAAARASGATAVFCGNDLLAMGFVDALRQSCLNIPGLVGFDDLPEAAWGAYDLTSFRQDPEEMARAAVDLLSHRKENPQAAPQLRVIRPRLVVRGSFAPL